MSAAAVAHAAALDVAPRPVVTHPRFSIIAPLFDCRDAGWGALESALDQSFARDRYEVIAVVTRLRQVPAKLLARCDRVVPVAADAGDVASEVVLFDAGARAARGDFLFFIEGHTVLCPDALARVAECLERAPRTDIVCGARRSHARTRLGTLIGANNDRHALRAAHGGSFTLGGHCVIRRSRFQGLGGFEPRFLRFNETVLFRRAIGLGAAVATTDAVLCTHHNDARFAWLVRLLTATGRAKSRYYRTLDATQTARAQLRHPVYRWFGTRAAAALAALPLVVAGPAVIAVSMALVRRAPRIAQRLYLLGVGGTDVAGFCLERSTA